MKTFSVTLNTLRYAVTALNASEALSKALADLPLRTKEAIVAIKVTELTRTKYLVTTIDNSFKSYASAISHIEAEVQVRTQFPKQTAGHKLDVRRAA